jgi:hypothetical protein
MITRSSNIEERLFYCERIRVKLLPEACVRMQAYAKDPPRMNPLSSCCFNPDYLKCIDCEKGQSFIDAGITITIEQKEKIYKHRGRIPKSHLCKTCGEIDPDKFERNQKSMCMPCRIIQRRGNRDKKEETNGEE